MYAYLLLLSSMCITTLDQVLAKKLQLTFPTGIRSFIQYNFLNAALAAINLLVLNRFRLQCNLATLAYSLLFAVVVCANLTLSLLALKCVSIPLSTILTTAGNVILSTYFSALVLKEVLPVSQLFAVGLLLLAIILPFSGALQKMRKGTLPICILLFLGSGANIILIKCYTLDQRVYPVESFYILTNLAILALTGTSLACYTVFSRAKPRQVFRPFSKKQTLRIAVRTLLANVNSLLTAAAVGLMQLSVYSVTTASFSILASAFISFFLFQERLTKAQLYAVGLAILAVFLTLGIEA